MLKVIKRVIRNRLLEPTRKAIYYYKTGLVLDGERVSPDFPDWIFENHLKVYKFLKQFSPGKDILDVGCGTGYGTALLAEEAKSIVGVDISAAAIRWASKHYPETKYQEMDVQQLMFPDDTFDLIVSSENFEHLQDQKSHVMELSRVLRPDGICFVASPNPEMTIGENNPFHMKENSYDELMTLFSAHFAKVTILENMLNPPTEEGRQIRQERWDAGSVGAPLSPDIDPTWLHNTYSFFCFARQPKKHKPAN